MPDHGHDPPLGYAIHRWSDQDRHSADDVLALWERVAPDEARRGELVAVATAPDGSVAGACTAQVTRNAQLGMDMWHCRVLVAGEHRRAALALFLALEGVARLREAWASGADRRAGGVVLVVDHPGLKKVLDQAHWMPLDFVFIGVTAAGDHVRVHFFDGAVVPAPG